MRACFSSAGQLCVSMERLYVADQVYDEFLGGSSNGCTACGSRADLEYGADMGSLISQRQLDTVERHVEDARDQGRPGPRRRPPSTRRRTAVLRAHRAGRRAAGDGVLRRGDVRTGRVGLPLRRRGRCRLPRQRRAVRPQRRDPDPRHPPRPRARPPDPLRQRQHQRGLRRVLRLDRRAHGRHAAARGSGAVKGPRGSSGSPTRRPWRPSGCCRSVRCSGSRNATTPRRSRPP